MYPRWQYRTRTVNFSAKGGMRCRGHPRNTCASRVLARSCDETNSPRIGTRTLTYLPKEMKFMVAYVFRFEIDPAKEDEYRQLVQGIVPRIMKAPGLKEFRAYRPV